MIELLDFLINFRKKGLLAFNGLCLLDELGQLPATGAGFFIKVVGPVGLDFQQSLLDFVDDFIIYADDVLLAKKTLAAFAAISEGCK